MLKGSKTWIRPLNEDDIDLLLQWYNDQEYNLWSTGGWPLNTLLTREEMIDKLFDEASDRRHYGILDENQNLIGKIGFGDIDVTARSAVVFIGIGLKDYWGQQYGTDALTTFVEFLFRQWNFNRLTIDTWDGNERALKSYQRIGFQLEGRLRQARYVMGDYRDSIILGLLRDEFFLSQGK